MLLSNLNFSSQSNDELVQRTMGELCFKSSKLDKFRQSEDPQGSNPRAHKPDKDNWA